MRILGVIPFFQATKQHLVKQQLKGEKWDVGSLSAFGWAVLLCLTFVKKKKKNVKKKISVWEQQKHNYVCCHFVPSSL